MNMFLTKKHFVSLFVLLIIFNLFSINIYAAENKKIIYNYTNENEPYDIILDSEESGFNIDLLKLIFNNDKYELNITDKNFQASDNNIKLTFTTDDTKKNLLSDVIYYQDISVFSYNNYKIKDFSIKNLSKYKIGVLKNSYSNTFCSLNKLNYLTFDSTNEGIESMKNGQVELWMGDLKNIDYQTIKNNNNLNLNFYSKVIKSIPIRIQTSEKNENLIKFINQQISKMKNSGEFEDLYLKFFHENSKEYIEKNNINKFMTYLSLSLLIIVFVFSLTFKKIQDMFEKQRFSNTIAKNMLNYGNRFVILWKSDYSYYEVNNYLKDNFGLSKEIMPPNIKKIFENDFKKEDLINPSAVMTSSKDKNGEIREIFWTSIIIDVKKNVKTILSIGSDATEKNKLKRLLDTSNQRYQVAMESTAIAMIFIDKDGNIPYLSDVGYDLIGLNKDIKIDMSVFLNRIHPDDREKLENIIISSVTDLKKSDCEIRILNQKGKFLWFKMKFKLINDSVTNDSCLAGIFFDINENKEKDLRIQKLAFEDELTGIYNRQKFLSVLKRTIKNADINVSRYAVVTLNLDKFHRFNDLYGVDAGDIILKNVANIIKYNPYGKDCTCARLGNDEFACLIRLDLNEENLKNYVEELSRKIQKFCSEEYDKIKLTISAGGCIYPDNVDNYEELFELSIFSMRIAKNDSNIIYQPYDSSIKEMILQREMIEKELLEALEKNQFELYYQPKVDIYTEEIVGAEALIRWNHPTKGIVSPALFIPIAEEMGIITEIGKWTLRTACTQNKKWQDEGCKKIKVSVNISSIEFYHSNIVEQVKTVLEETGLDSQWLEIELTESMALIDLDATIVKMNALKQIGVGISMDDFGTGYSSLSYIQNLPIDELKLDKSFINKITLDETSKNITSAIINLAKTIGLVVVAEGVEKKEQFELLKIMNCNIIQGYLFAKPMKKDDIINMIIESNKKITMQDYGPKMIIC